MSEPGPALLTVGEISRRTGATIHQVEYILRTREIAPRGRAGNVRVYAEADVARIAAVLKEIAADRGGNS